MSDYISKTSLPGLLTIQRPLRQDERGFFHEVVRPADLTEFTGQEFKVCQVNHSRSNKGVLRGLHAERWDKIVWVSRGQAFSAIVDIRTESPTFGRYQLFELSEENGLALYIPDGFANSIYARTDIDYLYLVNKTYDGSDTRAIAWDDPQLAIPWPNKEPVLSQRDQANPPLCELFPEYFKA